MTEGRNEAGQFTEGNTFSDGRNKHLHAAELRQMFCEAITEGEIQRLAYKLIGMALDGDMQAAKLVLNTVFKDPPPPTVAVQVNNVTPVESVSDSAKRIVAKIRAERAADPEAAEQRRQEALHRAGFARGENPNARQIMDRIISQRADETADVRPC